jgi:hypothetical protein
MRFIWGETIPTGSEYEAFATFDDGGCEGACIDGVIGTYLHGAFEHPEVLAGIGINVNTMAAPRTSKLSPIGSIRSAGGSSNCSYDLRRRSGDFLRKYFFPGGATSGQRLNVDSQRGRTRMSRIKVIHPLGKLAGMARPVSSILVHADDSRHPLSNQNSRRPSSAIILGELSPPSPTPSSPVGGAVV